MLKAILFDRDGTLMDSQEINRQFWRDLIKRAGYPEPSSFEVEKVLHKTVWDGIKDLIKKEDEKEIQRIFDLKFAVPYHTELIKYLPVEAEVLRNLSQQYKLALVTNYQFNGF